MAKRVKIVIADDHPVLVDGLAQLLSSDPAFEVVSRATNGAQALKDIESLRPDVAILDLRMPDADGLEVLRRLQESQASVRVILLAGLLNDAEIFAAAKLGVAGILFKDAATTALLACVRTVASGGTWLSEDTVAAAIERGHQMTSAWKERAPSLTSREVELLGLARLGRSNKEIATALAVSEGTVKVHFHNIFRKFGVGSRNEVLLIVAQAEQS